MATVRVQHTIGDLVKDATRVTTRAKPEMAKVVKKNARAGRSAARRIAKSQAGPHGASYFKRIDDEMLDPLTGEYGPSALKGSRYVGVNFSGGGPGLDLDKSLDIVGPKFRREIGNAADGLFW